MLVNTLVADSVVEIAYTVSYKNYYIVVRQINPTRSDYRPWFTCYIKRVKDFTEDELDSLPMLITYNSVYSKTWVDSELRDEYVIGWDYNHGLEEEKDISIQSIIKDAYNVIDYISNNLIK